jgi:hypothetical protein
VYVGVSSLELNTGGTTSWLTYFGIVLGSKVTGMVFTASVLAANDDVAMTVISMVVKIAMDFLLFI